jgi:DNA-binding NarL/FixJ family response regulator
LAQNAANLDDGGAEMQLAPSHTTFHDLPRHLRQTLFCLLEGASEKEAAARLGLSRHTVHGYVTALYRRFGVNSRAELLVLCLRSWPTDPPD